MSRGVRDLRELICVSRLSVVDSDPEDRETSDSEDQTEEVLDRSLSGLSFEHDDVTNVASFSSDARQSRVLSRRSLPSLGENRGAHSARHHRVTVPAAREAFSEKSKQGGSRFSLSKSISCALPATTDGKHMTKSSHLAPVTPSNGHELHGESSDPVSVWEDASSGQGGDRASAGPFTPDSDRDAREPSNGLQSYADRNYDALLRCVEPDVVSIWLEQANTSIVDLDAWCHAGENFVRLAQHWLADVPRESRTELIQLEHQLLVCQLSLAFSSSLEGGRVTQQDLTAFLGAILREYPTRMLGSRGAGLFLDYLDVLSSGKSERYRMLLSDVKCWTRVPQHAQWVLAIRSFALVKVWTAVVAFVRHRMEGGGSGGVQEERGARKRGGAEGRQSGEEKSWDAEVSVDVNNERMFQAVRLGYIEVVQYLLQSGKVSPRLVDSQRRSLIFQAVICNKPRLLRFLLSQVTHGVDATAVADSGNTALHAAANMGVVALVKELLEAKGVQVNATNAQCDNATPLHIAVLHGHMEVVQLLMEARADPRLLMGRASALDLARDFKHSEILDFFTRASR